MPPPTGQPYRGAYLQDRLANEYGSQTKAQLEANLDRIYKLIRGINDNGELPAGEENAFLVYLDGAWTILEFNATAQRVIGNSTGAPAWEQVDLTTGVTGRLPFANLAQVAASKLLGRGSAAIASEIRTMHANFVFLATRGTSDNAGRYANYLWGAYNAIPVALATPSLFTFYQKPPRLNNALVLGVSQSGKSPDIVSVLKEGRKQGCLTLAITNEPKSPLASMRLTL